MSLRCCWLVKIAPACSASFRARANAAEDRTRCETLRPAVALSFGFDDNRRKLMCTVLETIIVLAQIANTSATETTARWNRRKLEPVVAGAWFLALDRPPDSAACRRRGAKTAGARTMAEGGGSTVLRSRRLQVADAGRALAYGVSTATDGNRRILPRSLGSESFGPTRTFPRHSCHGQPLLHMPRRRLRESRFKEAKHMTRRKWLRRILYHLLH
jgi:hypothetical protein